MNAAERLRSRGVDWLADLLRLRPDLATPLPNDLADLAARSQSPASLARALAGLDHDQLRVLIGVAARVEDSLLVTATERGLEEVLTELDARELVVDGEATPTVRRLLGPQPAGLAPASSVALSAQVIADRLAMIGAPEQAVLDRLVWGPPYGSVTEAIRRARRGDPDDPITRLLGLGLLRPVDRVTVILPREVALVLRAGRLFAADAVLPDFQAESQLALVDLPTQELAVWLLGEASGTDWRAVLRRAAADDHWVRLIHARDDGTVGFEVARVLLIGQGSAHLVRRAGRRFSVPLSRVIAAELLGPVVISGLDIPG